MTLAFYWARLVVLELCNAFFVIYVMPYRVTLHQVASAINFLTSDIGNEFINDAVRPLGTWWLNLIVEGARSTDLIDMKSKGAGVVREHPYMTSALRGEGG